MDTSRQTPRPAGIRYAGNSARRHANRASPSYVSVSSCAGHGLRASRFADDSDRTRLLQANARPLRRGEHACVSQLLPDGPSLAPGWRRSADVSLGASGSDRRAGFADPVRIVLSPRVQWTGGSTPTPASPSLAGLWHCNLKNLIPSSFANKSWIRA